VDDHAVGQPLTQVVAYVANELPYGNTVCRDGSLSLTGWIRSVIPILADAYSEARVLDSRSAADCAAGSREEIDPVAALRPARRRYRLTAHEVASARVELAPLSGQLRLPADTDLRRR
jgi:hypothetical protein